MISVYSDGSSSGRSDKPGGWAFVILVDGKHTRCGSGGDPKTTNNRMEMTAALKGLQEVERMGLQGAVELVSDSDITLGIASGKYTASSNLDLAFPLREIAHRLKCRSRWVKGHSGDPVNERVDRLAKREKKKLELA